MKTIFRFIFGSMSAVQGTAVVDSGEALEKSHAAVMPAIEPTKSTIRRLNDGSRTGLSIGIAVALHACLGLVHVARTRGPALAHLVQEADFFEVEPLAPPVPPPVAAPPPERPVVRREEPTQEAPPAEQPPPNPAVGNVVPDEVVPTPQIEVATSTEGGLAVAAVVGNGSGLGSGSGTRHDGPAVEGTPVAAAAPAFDPRPARRAYVQRVRGVVGAPRYTNAMRRRGVEGTVLVGLTIDPQGHVIASRVKRSSGDAELDQMVLDYVRANIGSLPAPPTESQWQTNEVGLPYEFDLAED